MKYSITCYVNGVEMKTAGIFTWEECKRIVTTLSDLTNEITIKGVK